MSTEREKITAQDIIDLLPIVADRGWAEGALIRTSTDRVSDYFCPITALVHEINGETFAVHLTTHAMRSLGFGLEGTDDARRQIQAAADNRGDPMLRAKIRVALGLAPDTTLVQVKR